MTPEATASKWEMPPVAITGELDEILRQGSALLAVGVSGGKDSQACALAVAASALRMAGPNTHLVLVHADLGVVEWGESLPVCEKLARHIGAELLTVRRGAGGLMERFESRWESSKRRYSALETMKLVLPFSTPSMRFCTSELKTKVITPELRRRATSLGLNRVINACGIRREESPARSRSKVAEKNEGESTQRIQLWNWNPIVEWKINDVFSTIAESGLSLHRAYTEHGMTRVSCRFCIMSSGPDIQAAAAVPENHDLLRRIVKLEIASTFGFQGSKWLADAKPEIFSRSEQLAIEKAKLAARVREEAEATLPKDLLHEKAGWPRRMPNESEAELIAGVRRQVAAAVGIDVAYTTAPAVMARFTELLEARGEIRSEVNPAPITPGQRPGRRTALAV